VNSQSAAILELWPPKTVITVEETTMNRRVLLGGVLAVVVVAILAGVGISVYDAGVAQGIAESSRVATREPAVGAPAVGPYAYHPYGPSFRPHWFLFPLFPLLWFLLIFLLIRAFFWRPFGGWHGDRGTARIEEWHRRAHEAEAPKAE
jgi:hypothetical protein